MAEQGDGCFLVDCKIAKVRVNSEGCQSLFAFSRPFHLKAKIAMSCALHDGLRASQFHIRAHAFGERKVATA